MGCHFSYFAKFSGFGTNEYSAINELRINIEKMCTMNEYYETTDKGIKMYNIKYMHNNSNYNKKITLAYNEKHKIWGAFVY